MQYLPEESPFIRLILLRSNCEVGRACTSINATDQGTYVGQGYLIPDHAGLPPGESVVKASASLLPELAGRDAAYDAICRTDHRTVLIRGHTLVDLAALRKLNLPAGEAIEIPMSALPALEIANVR